MKVRKFMLWKTEDLHATIAVLRTEISEFKSAMLERGTGEP
jgi:hypothetical protein